MPPDNSFEVRAPGEEITNIFHRFFHTLLDEIHCEKHIPDEHDENGHFQEAATKKW